MSAAWKREERMSEEYFNGLDYKYNEEHNIVPDFRQDLSVFDLDSFRKLNIAIKQSEEKINKPTLSNNNPTIVSSNNASSYTQTYYPDTQTSIVSSNNTSSQKPHIEIDRSCDPMDSISNTGTFFPELPKTQRIPRRSHSHSPRPHRNNNTNTNLNVNNKSQSVYQRNLLTPYTYRNHRHKYASSTKLKYRKNSNIRRKRNRKEMEYTNYVSDSPTDSYYSSSAASEMSLSSYHSNKSGRKRRKVKKKTHTPTPTIHTPTPTTPTASNHFAAGAINNRTIQQGGMNIQYVKNLNLDSANITGLDLSINNKQNDNNNNNNNNNNTQCESFAKNIEIENNCGVKRLKRLR